MIFGVWISTKPFLVRVSLKSWHTPDCRRKIAWLVVVLAREHTTHNTHTAIITTFDMILWICCTIICKNRTANFCSCNYSTLTLKHFAVKGEMCIPSQQKLHNHHKYINARTKAVRKHLGITVKPPKFWGVFSSALTSSFTWLISNHHKISTVELYWLSAPVIIHHDNRTYSTGQPGLHYLKGCISHFISGACSVLNRPCLVWLTLGRKERW